MRGWAIYVTFIQRLLTEYAEFRRIHGALEFKHDLIRSLANDSAAVFFEKFNVNLLKFMNQFNCSVFVNVEQLPVALDVSKEDRG